MGDPLSLSHADARRPGVRDFLTRAAAVYEMHIYTMGLSAYIDQVMPLIDPDGRLFGQRILTRDNTPQLGLRKAVERLFPGDHSMVVVIDDSPQVWQGTDNLVKVYPCTRL